MRINNTKIILTTFICLLSSLFVKAANETVTMKVGATRTLYLPSYVTSKNIHGSQWTSTRPDEIAVVSQTSYSVTIKAIKSVPSSTTCLVHCQYYYLQAIGTFTYMATGIYDFKILTESIKPVSISLPFDVGKNKYLPPIIVPENEETNLEWSSLVSEPDTKGPLVGTFTETVIGEGCYKLASDGQSFAQTKTASAVCKPFRAYIKK